LDRLESLVAVSKGNAVVTFADRQKCVAAHRKLDRRRDDLCAVESGKDV
jgi:hypothetical protein